MADTADFLNSLPLNASYQYDYLLRDVVNWYFLHQSTIWTAILLTPLVVTFMLPVIMLFLVYVSALYLKAFRYYHKINGYEFTSKSWEPARHLLAYLWNLQAKFWYGYEVVGLENIPLEGSALIVFYHGAMPVDWYYLLANVILRNKEYNMCAVGDRFLFSIPAFDDLIDCLQVYPGTVETCADLLKKGNLLSIAPGGVREALFGDETYPLIWGSRKGFAKVAMEAQVPIIPVFTENIREAFFTLSFGRNFLRKVYERSRIPLVPIYGGFPVKLRTYVGKPINYDPSITPEEMAVKVADKMKEMIALHQTLPGSLTGSILQRFGSLFNFKSS